MSQNNYPKAHIYKLCCKDLEIKDIYIGSTINWRRRKARHKNNCNNISSKEHNYMVYKFIRQCGGWNNWDMILIKEVNCNNKLELHREERKYIEALKATLNIGIPARTKEERLIYYKNYNEIYRKKFKNEIQLKKKEYYNKNRIDILNRKKIDLYTCICCNLIIQKNSCSRHFKSKSHIKNYGEFVEKSAVATPLFIGSVSAPIPSFPSPYAAPPSNAPTPAPIIVPSGPIAEPASAEAAIVPVNPAAAPPAAPPPISDNDNAVSSVPPNDLIPL